MECMDIVAAHCDAELDEVTQGAQASNQTYQQCSDGEQLWRVNQFKSFIMVHHSVKKSKSESFIFNSFSSGV